jgi:L-fucose mutarotase
MTILKSIPRIINPQLLFALARMGHGDEIVSAATALRARSPRRIRLHCTSLFHVQVLADANFPASSVAKHTTLGEEIRCDGSSIPDLLNGIMKLFPLDETAPPAMLMGMMEEHKAAGWKTPIWDVYKKIVNEGNGKPVEFIEIERFAFYERAKTAYCVVATGETALYGNLILKKGVIGSATD